MLIARSDVMSVAVPVTSGGCGVIHSRPVADGVPVPEWDLEKDCPRCAQTRRGDPLWAATVAEMPETPDERIAREDALKRSENALRKAQENTTVKLTEVTTQQAEMTGHILELLRQQKTAEVPGEDVIAELVAREVAKALAGGYQPVLFEQQGPLVPDYSELVQPPLPLERLHVRTLGKMCRERGLDDKGSKADLIARLAA